MKFALSLVSCLWLSTSFFAQNIREMTVSPEVDVVATKYLDFDETPNYLIGTYGKTMMYSSWDDHISTWGDAVFFDKESLEVLHMFEGEREFEFMDEDASLLEYGVAGDAVFYFYSRYNEEEDSCWLIQRKITADGGDESKIIFRLSAQEDLPHQKHFPLSFSKELLIIGNPVDKKEVFISLIEGELPESSDQQVHAYDPLTGTLSALELKNVPPLHFQFKVLGRSDESILLYASSIDGSRSELGDDRSGTAPRITGLYKCELNGPGVSLTGRVDNFRFPVAAGNEYVIRRDGVVNSFMMGLQENKVGVLMRSFDVRSMQMVSSKFIELPAAFIDNQVMSFSIIQDVLAELSPRNGTWSFQLTNLNPRDSGGYYLVFFNAHQEQSFDVSYSNSLLMSISENGDVEWTETMLRDHRSLSPYTSNYLSLERNNDLYLCLIDEEENAPLWQDYMANRTTEREKLSDSDDGLMYELKVSPNGQIEYVQTHVLPEESDNLDPSLWKCFPSEDGTAIYTHYYRRGSMYLVRVEL